MKRKIIFKKDGKITSEGEIDVRAGEYIVDGDVGSGGGTADFNAKEGEPGYIANKPLSKTVTTETTTYGSGNTYIDIYNAQPGPGGDVFGYIYSANGGSDPVGGGTLTAHELYCARMIMPTEPGNPTTEMIDMGYIGVTSSNMRVVFNLIESWLTEDQQSGSTNYVDIYNSRVFFKPDEEIKTANDFDSAAFDIIGLDPEDPSLTPEILRQAIEAHESEVLAFCDNYIYKTAGGIFVITPYIWSEQEQTDVAKAYIAGPSNTYMNYWGISSGHKVVENYAELRNDVSTVILSPVISEVYGADPTEEQEDAFHDKAAETTLSDLGMSSIVEITTTTTEYQQLEEGYLPDSTRVVLNTPRIIGTVPADANSTGKDLPIVECTVLEQKTINNNGFQLKVPDSVQAILNEAVLGDSSVFGSGANCIIEPLNILYAQVAAGTSIDRLTWNPVYYGESYAGMSYSYVSCKFEKSIPNGTNCFIFYTIRVYPFGGVSDGMG